MKGIVMSKVPTTEQIRIYKSLLKEYEMLYEKYLLGMRDGYKAYEKLEQLVLHQSKYLLMLEKMFPTLVEHKPAKYKAIYKPLKHVE